VSLVALIVCLNTMYIVYTLQTQVVTSVLDIQFNNSDESPKRMGFVDVGDNWLTTRWNNTGFCAGPPNCIQSCSKETQWRRATESRYPMGGPMKTVPYPNTPIYTGLRQSSDQTLLFTQDYDSPPSQHSYSESLIYHQFKGSNPIFQQK